MTHIARRLGGLTLACLLCWSWLYPSDSADAQGCTGSSLSFSTSIGAPGSTTQVSGSWTSFPAGGQAYSLIYVDGSIALANDFTSSGSFQKTITIPATASTGSHTIKASTSGCPDLTGSFTVTPKPATATPNITATPLPAATCTSPSLASVSPSSVLQGGQATFTASGFAPGSQVTVNVSGPSTIPLQMRTAEQTCVVTVTLNVGTGDATGTYQVVASGTRFGAFTVGYQQTVSYTVVIAQTRTPTPEPMTGASTATPQPSPTAQPTATPTATVRPTPTGRDASIGPVSLVQGLNRTGGAPLPIVGQTIEYEHVVRVTNNGLGAVALGVEFITEYGSDASVTGAIARFGATTVGSTSFEWTGDLAAGESVDLRTTLRQNPPAAGELNRPIQRQSLTVSDAATGASLDLPTASLPTPPLLPPALRVVQPAARLVDPINGARYFEQSGFAVPDDRIWTYFVRRGGESTFGQPISRAMLLNGGWVQIFERGMLQVFDDGTVATVNLLEAPFLPYDTLGDLQLPPVSGVLVASAPNPAAADYVARAQEFIRQNVPNQFDGRDTNFYTTFLITVPFSDAFFDGNGDPNLLPIFDLEIWGLPTSLPSYQMSGPDQVDLGVVLQRWQRAVMLRNHGSETTEAVPLGTYVKAILTAQDVPAGLAGEATSNPLWGLYDPTAQNSVSHTGLPDTNLTLAFEPD